MGIKDKISKLGNAIKEHSLEIILLGFMVGLPAGIMEYDRIRTNNYYNSLPKQEKIEYLQSIIDHYPRAIFRPSLLAMSGKEKREAEKKLTELKNQ